MIKFIVFKTKNFINVKFFILIVSFVFLSTALIGSERGPFRLTSDKHLMTIYIHGTVLPTLSIKAFKVARRNTSNKSFYTRYLMALRNRPSYRLQMIGPLGLERINLPKKNDGVLSNHFISQIHKKIYERQNKGYSSYSFYTFGWDGRLSSRKRKQWSQRLYIDLIREIKEQGLSNLEIQIMAHSHGGNVALHLDDVEKRLKKNLFINKLVLLGTPVQSETERSIGSSLFNRIYHLYSSSDMLQVLDVISTRDFFSRRKFVSRAEKNFLIPSNLSQVELNVGKLKPYHTELWLWGKSLFCRSRTSIYPFPVMAFVPVITRLSDLSLNDDQNIIINISGNKGKKTFNFIATKFDGLCLQKSTLKIQGIKQALH